MSHSFHSNNVHQKPVYPARQSRGVGRAILMALAFLGLLFLVWHIALPLLGISIALTAGVVMALVASVGVICVGALLFGLLAGTGALFAGLFPVVWLLVVIALLPVLLPLFLPIIIVLLLVNLLCR